MRFIVSILALMALGQCSPVVQENETVLRSVIGNFVNCMNSDLSLCLKEKALLVTERIGSMRQLKLTEGVTILNSAPEKEGRSYEPLSTDVEVRKKQVSERLYERAQRLIENSDLELSIPTPYDDDEEEQARSVGEGRDKKKKEIKKKLKVLMPLLALLKAKAIAAITLAIIVIAVSLFKIAVLAKLAFIVKAFYIIKQLLSKHHGHEEWIPHHEEHHGHGMGWDGGWQRSRTEANNLAYSAYTN